MTIGLRFPPVEFFSVQNSSSPAIDLASVGISSPNSAPVNETLLLDTKPLPSELPPILCLNDDVSVLIVETLLQSYNGFRSVLKLSTCCRRFRQLCLPFVFSRCAILSATPHQMGVPPVNIRSHVRHLTFNWAAYARQYLDSFRPGFALEFGQVLSFLPHVRSLKFTGATGGVPWQALATCMGYPQVKSISFTASALFIRTPLFPTDANSTASTLEELSYPTPLLLKSGFIVDPETGRESVVSHESACLSTLVLGMSSTAQSLVLPMQTAPFCNMATVDWPALQDLTLAGAFLLNFDFSNMSSALLRMPALRRLIITAAHPNNPPAVTRCCILSSKASSIDGLQRLRRLTIAYPDPSDSVFSTPLSELTELSLRDWPRHYDIAAHEYHSMWMSPILSATEALSISRRLHTPNLTTLELVYTADNADDDLVDFISRQFQRLRHLQLHRYRRSRDDTVNFRHIVQTLSALKMLVTLRLNLDFRDDPGEYNPKSGYRVIESWRDQLSVYGWEILDLLDSCSAFEGVALLFHGDAPSRWIWYMRSHRAARQSVTDSNRDTSPAPFLNRFGRRLTRRTPVFRLV